jgi:DNA-3-methyladenine glycosylase II
MPQDYKKGRRHLAKRSPELSALLKRHKVDFQPKLERSPYESLVRAIAHQQLHGKAAETILGRMLALFPKVDFPEAPLLHRLSDEKLRACGFSTSKTKAIKDIAEKTLSGVVPTGREIVRLSNDEIIERLTEIYGVGRWTVEMLLIFQLGRLDVWPVDDFGVRRGFQIWRRKRAMPTAKELRAFSEDFAPYQSIVALHLWREADLAKVK